MSGNGEIGVYECVYEHVGSAFAPDFCPYSCTYSYTQISSSLVLPVGVDMAQKARSSKRVG